MPRTRQRLLRAGIALGALLALLVALLAWLLYTPSGLRFALDRGVAITQGAFTYAGARGSLAGEATLEGLCYKDDGTILRIRHATLDLQPWALLARRLHVRKARVDGIALDLAPSQATQESGSFSLQPPLTIALDDVRLGGIAVSQNGKPVFAANGLALAGAWSRRGIVIRQLALRAPDGHADLAGTLAIAHGYRGQGKASFDWTAGGTRYTGGITARSDGKTASLRGTLTAPVQLTLDASLKLDQGHAWTLALHAPTFAANALPSLPAALHTLALDVRGAGDAHGGKLEGNVSANDHVVLIDPAQFAYDGKMLKLDALRLRAPSMPGVLSATGSVHLDAKPVSAALDIDWRDVQLPADLVGQPLDTHGAVHLDGSALRFALKGGFAIGPPDRLANLTIDLTGTPQAIQLNALKLVQKDGGLEARGNIGLQPSVDWKLDAVARKFDPGAFIAGWDGALDFTLASTGQLTPQGPAATLKLGNAGGNLRGRSIVGSKADFRIAPGNLFAGSLRLVAGHSRVDARGAPGQRTNATVDVDIASLADWLPGASGKLRGRFTAKGTWPHLAVAGTLEGNALRAGANGIDTLQLNASIPDVGKPGGDLALALTGMHAAGFDFESLRIEGHGNAASHHLRVAARGNPLGFALAMQGSWQARAGKWTGSVSDVELSPRGLPAWHQQQPSRITWQDGNAALSPLCLSADTPQLCVSGERSANGALGASYRLQQLPLQWLATLAATTTPMQADGEISGSGKLALDAKGTLAGHASLALSAGRIAFTATANQPLLAWSSITLDATAAGTGIHATLRGALDDGGHVDGAVDVRDTAHALAGNLDVGLRSLAFLGALTPEIANAQGTLAGNLQLAGTLASPQFHGGIHADGFSAELPRAGLKLHDGRFAVTGDQQGRLAITGQLASGAGVLHVGGSAGFAAAAPLSLDIKGDNVLVADIPAARVLASPDLHVARTNGMFALTGTVAIPHAKIEVEKLPGQGPAKASPDVVIVDAPPAAEVAPMAMRADIGVKLGDDVKLRGYGLDGSVAGQLAMQVRPGQAATGRGEIRVAGKYEAYGQNLAIERGRLLFASTPLDNPGLDIRAVRAIHSQDITVGLAVRGTARRPVLSVFSAPAMEQAEALSYLVTGRPLDALKSGEGDTLNTAAQALGGLAGDQLAKSIGSRLGLEAGVSSSEALGGSAFTAGKYLSPRLFLSYGVGLFTPGQVITLRYTLNRFLQFEAQNATTGNRASFNYRIEK